MSARRILLTGAGGFVGRHLIPALAAALPGAEVLAPGFDVADGEATARAVREAAPDGCIHLAAVSAVADARADPDRAWRVNLMGTLTLARAIAAHAPACRLVFAGSADAYGATFRRGAPLDEEAPLAPLNAYGATKAATDLALGAMARDGLDVVRVRAFNHTGPGQSADFVVPAFARQSARIAAGLQTRLQVGALDPLRDFLDVRDVCRAYALCLTSDILPGTVLNIASGTPRRVGDILAELLALAGVDARPETDPARLRPADIPTASGNAARARAMLGWAPRIAWPTTLKDVLDDWRRRVAVGE